MITRINVDGNVLNSPDVPRSRICVNCNLGSFICHCAYFELSNCIKIRVESIELNEEKFVTLKGINEKLNLLSFLLVSIKGILDFVDANT